MGAYLQRLHGRPFDIDSLSVASSGVSALMVAMQAILDPGDRVVVVTPVWPNIAEIPRILGAEVVRFGLRPTAEGWRLDLDRLLERPIARRPKPHRMIPMAFGRPATGR